MHGRGGLGRADPGQPCGCGEDKTPKPSELTAVAVAHPTDANPLNRAPERLVQFAQKHRVVLRQSSAWVGKFALIKQQLPGPRKTVPASLHPRTRAPKGMNIRSSRSRTLRLRERAALPDVEQVVS